MRSYVLVPPRTDNAVKNRFTTLCKKRAKHEALANENSSTYINLNNKRVIFPNGLNTGGGGGGSESGVPIKKMRYIKISISIYHEIYYWDQSYKVTYW